MKIIYSATVYTEKRHAIAQVAKRAWDVLLENLGYFV